MNNLLLIFLGGGIGSIARYGMMNGINRFTGGSAFPWHTLGVNLLGALVIGALMEFLALRVSMIEPWRLLLVTGFLGGFTTFSAFSMESAMLLQRGDYAAAGGYILASVIGTIIAVFGGSFLVRSFV